ncbi:MAG: AAA family ATPase [Sciscionella sp.]
MRGVQGSFLLEREDQLARLMALYAGCMAGRGGVAVLSGATGSGKTALLHEFESRLPADTVLLRAFGAAAERDLPLGVVGQVLPEVVQTSTDSAGFGAMYGFHAALQEISGRAPVVLVVDDAQHADDESLRCLLYAVRRSRSSRVLVVLAESTVLDAGQHRLRAELLRLPHACRIELGLLSEAAIMAFAGPRGREWFAATGGNPLLARALVERGDAHDPFATRAFGTAVRTLLDRGEPLHRRIAEAVAVLGDAGSPDRVAALLGIDPSSAERAMAELYETGLLAAGRFRHPAARAAVLDDMPAAARGELRCLAAHFPGAELAPAAAVRVLESTRLSGMCVDGIVDAVLTLAHADDQDAAKRWCDAFLAEALARHRADWRAPLDAVRAEIALRDGDLRLAEEHAERALAAVPEQSWGVRIALPLACLLRVRTERGDGRAAELARRSVPAAVDDTRYGVLLRYARGRWHAAAGRFQAALADFLRCGEIMAKLRIDQPSLVPWRSEAAMAHLRLGEADRARALALDELGRLGDSRTRARGITLTALALTGPRTARPGMLREAADILRDCGDRLELARTLAKLGHTHYLLGDHRRARTLTRRAENIARQCHAVPTGPGEKPVLSEAERRVAALAGSGHTNREIARRLYITVSTVEQHLTRVYRKLSVERRTELPARI